MTEKDWDKFIIEKGGSFLQSFSWGEFQKRYGRKIWRICGVEIIRYELPLGKGYFFSPYGPTVFNEAIIAWAKENARKENCIFWRFEPRSFEKIKGDFRKIENHNPSQTIILDLRKSDAEILAQMHPKTRYNIHLAERHGVEIINSWDESGLENFYNILLETSKRKKIKIFPKSYYEKLFYTLGSLGHMDLYLAKYQLKYLAGAMVVYFGNTATYFHGGMLDECKQVMAPYLMHWEIIKTAKKRNYKFYDFYGISEEKKWAGITRFKKGFGGKEITSLGTYEMPLNKFWYKLYKLAKSLK